MCVCVHNGLPVLNAWERRRYNCSLVTGPVWWKYSGKITLENLCLLSLPVQLSNMLCREGVLTYIVEKALADTCQPEQPLRADSAGKSLLPHRTCSPWAGHCASDLVMCSIFAFNGETAALSFPTAVFSEFLARASPRHVSDPERAELVCIHPSSFPGCYLLFFPQVGLLSKIVLVSAKASW